MNTYTISLPLRTISVLVQDKPQTAIEAEAFVFYIELHNELWSLKAHWQQCLDKLQEHKVYLQKCQDAYNAMEAEAKRYGTIGGYDREYLDLKDGKEFTLKLSDLQRLVKSLGECVDQYSESNIMLRKMFDEGMQLEEAFDESFHHFDKNYFDRIWNDYENVQVDTVSLDRDFDNFRGCCGDTDDIFQKFQNDWEALDPEADALDDNIRATNPHLTIICQGYETANPVNVNPLRAVLN